MNNWTAGDTCKVHNGKFRLTVSAGSAPQRRFYRALYDPAQQTGLSTLNNALLLPATPYDYTPALPLAFLQVPILGQDNMTANNPTTDAGAALGRVLL